MRARSSLIPELRRRIINARTGPPFQGKILPAGCPPGFPERGPWDRAAADRRGGGAAPPRLLRDLGDDEKIDREPEAARIAEEPDRKEGAEDAERPQDSFQGVF